MKLLKVIAITLTVAASLWFIWEVGKVMIAALGYQEKTMIKELKEKMDDMEVGIDDLKLRADQMLADLRKNLLKKANRYWKSFQKTLNMEDMWQAEECRKLAKTLVIKV